jgi:hypothetical protein
MALYYGMILLNTTMPEPVGPFHPPAPGLSDEVFRAALRAIVERSGRSLRALSLAMGRDEGYVAALLDARRPSRARPTPIDLLRASDATGIPLVTMLELLWGIDPGRLEDELAAIEREVSAEELGDADQALVDDFAGFLRARRDRHTRRRSSEDR